jgi:hypothetical protein
MLQKDSLKYREETSEALTGINETTRTFSLPARNVTVSAVFEPIPQNNFSISVKIDALEHGAIVAQPEFGLQGTPVFLVIIPDPGYRYKSNSLKYNDTHKDVSVDDSTRTFALPGEHVLVTAEFEAVSAAQYTVRTGVTPKGRISTKPDFSPAGGEIYLQVTPDPGYILAENSLKYKDSAGETAINGRRRTFIMPADHVTVTAVFVPVPGTGNYTVHAGNIPNGRIIPDPEYGQEKASVFLHVIPDPRYVLVQGSLKIKGPTVNRQVDEASRTFDMPGENINAVAEFKLLPADQYTVRTDVVEHGWIIAAPAYGTAGTPVSLRLQPEIGYRLKAGSLRYVTVSGLNIPVDEAAKGFLLPAEDITISAEFEKLPRGDYIVFTDITANGHINPSPESGPKGTEIYLWVIPDPGYIYKSGTLKFKTDEKPPRTESVPDSLRTFKLPASHVLADAEFEPVPAGKYTVRINPAVHGKLFASPEYAAPGETITVTNTPDPKYGLKKGSLRYAGDNGTPTSIDRTFVMPGRHITIYGEFESVQRTVSIDKNLTGGLITVKPEKAYPGETVSVSMAPNNGYRYEAGSLKYLDTDNRKILIDETAKKFVMPNDDITVTAGFPPYTAMSSLKINNRNLVTLVPGKTDYTIWIPGQDTDAVVTYETGAKVEAEPKSGTKHALKLFENAPVQYTIKDPDGITKTTYTFRMIKELVPTEQVPEGRFVLDDQGKSMEITKPFRIGKYEMTRDEWARVMGYERGQVGTGYPAYGLTWYEAVIFCNKLSALEKKTPVYSVNGKTNPDSWGSVGSNTVIKPDWNANGYRLPTEMEWLWAAAGANHGKSGTNPNVYQTYYAGYNFRIVDMDRYAWYARNAGSRYHLKGERLPNELNLFDMSGNVSEWCWDWYDNGAHYENIPEGRDYTGPDSGSLKIVRGGAIISEAWTAYLTFRGDGKVMPHLLPNTSREAQGMRIFCRD